MTESKPSYLALRRLVIRSAETIAYDEKFHFGLNIIRGENSSGKSTILDFIFYVLGGDVYIWKAAAARCTMVTAEVELNGIVVTLQREVSTERRRPLAIFYGPFEEAEKHRFENWKVFPYSKSSEAESFSMILFRLLGYPEAKSDLESNLTMHQVLRLAYVDQVSKTTALMREEDFDKPLIRRTIAEILFGIYDDTLYADELNRRDKVREVDAVSNQIMSVTAVMKEAGKDFDEDHVAKSLQKARDALDALNREIGRIEEGKRVLDTSQTETEKLRRQVTGLKEALASQNEKLENISVDIQDSAIFLDTLKNRVVALNESLVTRDALSDLPLCPLCDARVEEVEKKVVCKLSGHEIPGDFGTSKMLKMRDELLFQLKESTDLQNERLADEAEIKKSIAAISATLSIVQDNYREKVSAVKTARDNRLDDLYKQKGYEESTIAFYTKLSRYTEIIRGLREREAKLRGDIAEIDATIAAKKAKGAGRWSTAIQEITQSTFDILAKDFVRQEEFTHAKRLDLSFIHNTYFLNGRNYLSASSNAVLKNAIHFGLLFASTVDAEFRYPRFLLCDNIEDGGMEDERSRNFQKIIAAFSKDAPQPFQVIFSTSKIEPSLDNTELCVGPHYTHENKSLILAESLPDASTPLPEFGD